LNDRAVLEINLTVAYMNFVNRIASGLGVELEADLRAYTR
jgi:alkylhydroperoxidase family enzyme